MSLPEQPPIGDYAVIGDGRSAALVSRSGSIDWLCWPQFQSPSIFGALLEPTAGRFRISPPERCHTERRYLGESNVLETRFHARSGTLSLVDLMPVATEEEKRSMLVPEHEILRIARCLRGEVEVELLYEPRPGYGRWKTRWHRAGRLGLWLEAGSHLLALRAEVPVQLGGGIARARFRLRAGEAARCSLVYASETPAVLPPLGEWADRAVDRSIDVWRRWAARATYRGPHRDAVVRSALALKLLAYAPSGAIVAAPTTSLPERIGGDLNWDYRFCWLRDASFTARALFGLGYADEAEDFVGWLLHTTRLTRPALRVLYDIYGLDSPPEREVPEFSGYRGSRPVRIGNGARGQLQLDVYGEVIDATAQFVRLGGSLDRETSRMLVAFGEYVCDHWQTADEGIWEARSAPRQHTHSKVLCWTALDRLIELHRKRHLARTRVDAIDRFIRERAAIRKQVETRGYNRARATYTERLDDDQVDASLLLLPWYGYTSVEAPRMRSTFARIDDDLSAGGGLLYRYPESRDAREGAFGICSFWAAEYLALGGGTPEEAQARLEKLLGYGNDLMLFAEEVDPATGAPLGNFPQGFTHVGLINAALTLENRLCGREQLAHQRLQPAHTATEASL